jgi:hypothetical protein
MAWRGLSLCVAYKKEYSLLGTEFGDVTDAPVPLEGGLPAIQLINERELLLSANTDLGIFINYKVLRWLIYPHIEWSSIDANMNHMTRKYIIG